MSGALRRNVSTTTIHIMALDGIFNVNSLFTMGSFIGLSWYPTRNTIEVSPDCATGPEVAEDLIAFHIYSFSSFLFSSLIASALKQAIKIHKDDQEEESPGIGASLVKVNLAALRVGMLVSGIGSVLGCGFMMMALVSLVQVKLGSLACRSIYTLSAIAPLVVLVPLALLIYIWLVFHAFIN
ncbi:hypothetical protein SLE2022_195470 [Rubroshorea leprosula]